VKNKKIELTEVIKKTIESEQLDVVNMAIYNNISEFLIRIPENKSPFNFFDKLFSSFINLKLSKVANKISEKTNKDVSFQIANIDLKNKNLDIVLAIRF